MPKHNQHALITWIPDSQDGYREACRLYSLHRENTVMKPPTKLVAGELGDYMSTIVVGHREELLRPQIFQSLIQLLAGSGCTWLVLAACHSGEKKYFGPLGDNELMAPAQYLANRLKIKVSGTTRPLLFEEVGQGRAFAITLGEVLIRSNPNYDNTLWKDYMPQNNVDELTGMFKSL